MNNESILQCNFQALLLAWRLLLSKEEKSNEILAGLNRKDDSSITDSDTGTTSGNSVTTMESESQIESPKESIPKDGISGDRLDSTSVRQKHYFSAESLCLRSSSNNHNTERYLLCTPELEVSLILISSLFQGQFLSIILWYRYPVLKFYKWYIGWMFVAMQNSKALFHAPPVPTKMHFENGNMTHKLRNVFLLFHFQAISCFALWVLFDDYIHLWVTRRSLTLSFSY